MHVACKVQLAHCVSFPFWLPKESEAQIEDLEDEDPACSALVVCDSYPALLTQGQPEFELILVRTCRYLQTMLKKEQVFRKPLDENKR